MSVRNISVWNIRISLLIGGLLVSLATGAAAAEWPNWRGPNSNGTALAGNYPLQWGLDQNVTWKADLPGRAGSTPVVVKDRLILTCPVAEKNGVLCFDRQGNELWRSEIGAVVPGKHAKGSGTNPSPVTDGKSVFVYFKSGDLAALDLDGNVIWQTNLQKAYGEDTLWWDLGTSPVLTSQYVVVACVQTGPSYLVALDKTTGDVAWKVDRNLGAPEEAAQSYSTPIVTTYQSQEQVVVLGADHVTCHSATDGKEIWRVGGMNPDQEIYFRSIASPVILNDIVIAPYARGATLTAIRMGGQGDVTASHVLWTTDISADVPTPAAADGKVYVCTDRGTVVCLEAETGNELWSQALAKNRHVYSSSPVLAGEKLYLVREDATAFVLDVSENHVIEAENSLGRDEFTLSTPVLVDNTLYLRTFEHLFCFQNPAATVSQK